MLFSILQKGSHRFVEAFVVSTGSYLVKVIKVGVLFLLSLIFGITVFGIVPWQPILGHH